MKHATYPEIINFAGRIRYAVYSSGKEVKEVAREAGISTAAIYSWMDSDNKSKPLLSKLIRFSKAAEVSLTRLIDGTISDDSQDNTDGKAEKRPTDDFCTLRISGEYSSKKLAQILVAMPEMKVEVELKGFPGKAE